MIMSYNITFATPHRIKSSEKWLKLVISYELLVISFRKLSSLASIILYNFSSKNIDTLTYYRIINMIIFEARTRLNYNFRQTSPVNPAPDGAGRSRSEHY